MPVQLIWERYLTRKHDQSPFVQRATLFQDVVIRCVRYGFANLPPNIGRVFFSKWVSLPFLRFRMLRHGIVHSPIHWEDVRQEGMRGVYMTPDRTQRPDLVLYYLHGGGMVMGSPYFYMEFLMGLISLLQQAGYRNPAVFALDYTLAPDATYPTQTQETLAGYRYVLSLVGDSSRIVVGGDSAGGNLALSLLLCLSRFTNLRDKMPGFAVLISPWTIILSDGNRDTPSDYLNAETLHRYGSEYIGTKASSKDSLVSPGNCLDLQWWRRASPSNGIFFVYGGEEVFAPAIKKSMLETLKSAGVEVIAHEEKGDVHAWPVVKLFLCNKNRERTSGLRCIVDAIKTRIKSDVVR